MLKINRVAEGLAVIAGYGGAEVHAEHDVLYAGAKEPLSEEAKSRMEGLGWHWDAPCESWAIYT